MALEIGKLQLLAKTIRVLSAQAVERAGCGHPGLPMGAADYAAHLWAEVLRFNPQDPEWLGRDRFVLSAGHGSMLLYSLLHLFGYALSLDELKNFRQWESKTPGHPEFGVTPGIETTTGPLGQGFANGVGMALSGKLLAATYGSELFESRVFGIVSDGDLMEGIAAEAASLAGHLGLDNLIYIYDQNFISIGGGTSVCFTESVSKRFEAYNWFVQEIDGHDIEAFAEASAKAVAEGERPSLICARTTIGKGSPNKAGKASVHGEALGKDELKLTLENLAWHYGEFTVPDEVGRLCCERVGEKVKFYGAWQKEFAVWAARHPDRRVRLEAQLKRLVPAELKDALISLFAKPKSEATRNLSGEALQVIAKHVPFLVGGSADLEPSTKTTIKESPEIQRGAFSGRNIRFGVREHAMGGLANGLAYTKCWIPYTATFLVFSDYMRPAMRLAALSKVQALYIFTHDSIGVGEDGPTHQPVEHLASLRAIPNLYLFRPADGLEVAYCYLAALSLKESPSVIVLTRQKLAVLDRSEGDPADAILRGAYTLSGRRHTDLVLVATGSEVPLAAAAGVLLAQRGIFARIVSMPCVEIFLEQDETYRRELIPPSAKKVALEAGVRFGWERIVGSDGLAIGVDHFGASAPADLLFQKFGFTPEAVVERIGSWLR